LCPIQFFPASGLEQWLAQAKVNISAVVQCWNLALDSLWLLRGCMACPKMVPIFEPAMPAIISAHPQRSSNKSVQELKICQTFSKAKIGAAS
jgi:hypothetical protein